jgi:flagellar capping protein FliD
MQFRLTQKQAMLQKQYTTLDTLIAGLNTTSSYLTSQIAQFTANKNA